MRSVIAALIIAFCPLAQGWAAELGSPLSHAEALKAGLISDREADGLFKLWNECRPIAFGVHLQGEDKAEEIGLTKEAIETAVRSRLRGARIFRDNPDLRSQSLMPDKNGFLQVRVHLGGPAVSWSIRFEKLMTDWATDLVAWADTGWQTGAFGAHRDDSNFILSSIAPGIDKFIDNYLRVNEPSC